MHRHSNTQQLPNEQNNLLARLLAVKLYSILYGRVIETNGTLLTLHLPFRLGFGRGPTLAAAVDGDRFFFVRCTFQLNRGLLVSTACPVDERRSCPLFTPASRRMADLTQLQPRHNFCYVHFSPRLAALRPRPHKPLLLFWARDPRQGGLNQDIGKRETL